MTDNPGPSRAHDLVDQLEAKIVDLDAITAHEPHSVSAIEEIAAAVPGTVETPD